MAKKKTKHGKSKGGCGYQRPAAWSLNACDALMAIFGLYRVKS